MADRNFSATDPKPEARRPRRLRWLKWAAGVFGTLALVLAVLGVGLYVERARVATALAQRYLAQYGIQSEVAFGSLSWGGFLARVRAGPADAPDFTAERVEVSFVYPKSGFIGSVTPQIASVRLMRPFLRASYDGKTLSFGSLQPLLEGGAGSGAGGSGTGGPVPDVAIDGGRLLLSTPNGTLDLVADLRMSEGKLQHLQARVQPGTVNAPGFAAKLAGGTFTVDSAGATYRVGIALKADSLAVGGARLAGVALDTNLGGVQWQAQDGGYAFSLAGVTAKLRAASTDAGEANLGAANIGLTLASIDGTYSDGRLHAATRGDVRWDAAGLHAGGIALDAVNAQSTVSSLIFDLSKGVWSAAAAVRTIVAGTGAATPVADGMVTLAAFKADFGGSGTLASSSASAALKGTFTANGGLPRGIALRSVRVDFDGSGALDDTASTGMLRLSLAAGASVPRATARDLAQAIPGLGGDEAFVDAVSDALANANLRLRNLGIMQGVEGLTVTAGAPLTIAGAGGTNVTLRSRSGRALVDTYGKDVSGAFALDVGGGGLPQLRLTVSAYRYRGGANPRTTAEMQFQTGLDFGPLRGLTLAGAGNLQMTRAATIFSATDCADVRFGSFRRNGEAVLSGVAARFCGGAGRPLLALNRAGWQVQGVLTNASARIETGAVAIEGAGGQIQISGDGADISSAAGTVDKARLSDAAAAKRFQPIDMSGTLAAAGADWRGTFMLAAANHSLGTVTFRHSLATGAGEADIAARAIAFAPNGLQPANLAPFLSAFGTRVAGRADFTGRIAWSGDGIASGGSLTLSDLGFQSRLGTVHALNGTLAFRSLVPVALEPGQALAIQRVDSFVPLERISARFSYAPDALQLDSADASVAGGKIALDPMTYSLKPGATNTGTLRLDDVDVAPLLAAAGLAGRVSATARIDGAIPFTVGPDGVRFANGRVAANAPGRLSIKREALDSSVGVGGMTGTTPNAVQDFAYQALENLAFDQLDGTVDSRPMGRLGVLLHIKGRNDPATAAQPRIGIFDLLQGHAFDKPLPLPKGTPIDLTLDTSLNLDELLNSYFNAGATNANGRANASMK